MSYFKEVEGDVAILSIGGVFKQVPLYTLDGHLFAKAAGGFVRLNETGSTSKDRLRIVKLVTELDLYRDTHGRLTTVRGPKTRPIGQDNAAKLIAPPAESDAA